MNETVKFTVYLREKQPSTTWSDDRNLRISGSYPNNGGNPASGSLAAKLVAITMKTHVIGSMQSSNRQLSTLT